MKNFILLWKNFLKLVFDLDPKIIIPYVTIGSVYTLYFLTNTFVDNNSHIL